MSIDYVSGATFLWSHGNLLLPFLHDDSDHCEKKTGNFVCFEWYTEVLCFVLSRVLSMWYEILVMWWEIPHVCCVCSHVICVETYIWMGVFNRVLITDNYFMDHFDENILWNCHRMKKYMNKQDQRHMMESINTKIETVKRGFWDLGLISG